MYRARVDAVSGLQVRAGGKWLTCIGNRAVKAGDLVWTDGRCVYGHDRESQTPLVIAPPPIDWAVPVQLANGSLFVFRKNQLEPVGKLAADFRSATLLNDIKGNIYTSTADAANRDNEGNLYELDGSDARIQHGDSAALEQGVVIHIKRNGVTVRNISVTDLVPPLLASVNAKASEMAFKHFNPEAYKLGDGDFPVAGSTLYSAEFVSAISSAFIENENSWSIIYSVSATASAAILYNGIEGAGDNGGATYAHHYFIDSSGSRALIATRYHWAGDWSYAPAPKQELGEEESFPEIHDVKLPFQDGCFSQMTPATYKDLGVASPEGVAVPYVKHDCYSPDGKLLFSYNADFATRFTICQISQNSYLVGVDPMTYLAWGKNIVWGEGGLFICENGILSPLLDSDCKNFRLQKTRNYKRWLKRAQEFTEGSDFNA